VVRGVVQVWLCVAKCVVCTDGGGYAWLNVLGRCGCVWLK